jgi:hypothetical protein
VKNSSVPEVRFVNKRGFSSSSHIGFSFHPTTDPAVRACTLEELPTGPSCGLAGEARRERHARVEAASVGSYTILQGKEAVKEGRQKCVGGPYRQLSEFGLRKSAARGLSEGDELRSGRRALSRRIMPGKQ